MAEKETLHPSHDTRMSDASSFDEICKNCGATDHVPEGWGKLAKPCPKAPKQDGVKEFVIDLKQLKKCVIEGGKFFPCITKMVDVDFLEECGFTSYNIKKIEENENQLNGVGYLMPTVEIIAKLNIPFSLFKDALMNEDEISVIEGLSLKASLISKVYDELKRRGHEDLLKELKQHPLITIQYKDVEESFEIEEQIFKDSIELFQKKNKLTLAQTIKKLIDFGVRDIS